MNKVLWLLKHLTTLPWSPRGREMRTEKLMKETGEERDVAAVIVYSRDVSRNLRLQKDEEDDFSRICKRLESNEITLPADRKPKGGIVE